MARAASSTTARSLYRWSNFSSFSGRDTDLDHGSPDGQYFGLAEDLGRLFTHPVDLVKPEPIRNPLG